jgi:hypothetical protein
MKKRTLNEYRQTKEYQGSKEGRKYLDLENTKEEKIKKLDEEITKVFSPHKIPEKIKEITLNEQIQEIAEIVVPTINDVIFNEIIEVMDNYDELNWGYFVQDDAPTALLDACFEHKQEIHYKIFQLVLQKLK